MTKYFFCSESVTEMFLKCNKEPVFLGGQICFPQYAYVCFGYEFCIQIMALILVIVNYKYYICLI